MSVVFAATSVADFVLGGSAVAGDVTTTAANIAPYVAEGIDMDDNRQFTSPVFSGVTDFWASCYSLSPGNFSAPGELRFYDTSYSTSQPVFRVKQQGTFYTGWWTYLDFQMWNGSSWTTLVSSVTEAQTALTKFDFEIVKDASAGAARIYLSESLDAEATSIDTELVAWTSIDQVEWYLPSSSGGDAWYVSALIIADETTIGMKFIQETITADGTNTDFSGDYTDIDELGLDTGDSITSQATGEISTFTGNLDAVIDSGHDIVASVLSINYTVGGADKKVTAAYYISATDYEGGNETVSEGSGVVNLVQSTNPATASAWTPSEIEGAEFGVKNKAI
jgi:hypothetical protein